MVSTRNMVSSQSQNEPPFTRSMARHFAHLYKGDRRLWKLCRAADLPPQYGISPNDKRLFCLRTGLRPYYKTPQTGYPQSDYDTKHNNLFLPGTRLYYRKTYSFVTFKKNTQCKKTHYKYVLEPVW